MLNKTQSILTIDPYVLSCIIKYSFVVTSTFIFNHIKEKRTGVTDIQRQINISTFASCMTEILNYSEAISASFFEEPRTGKLNVDPVSFHGQVSVIDHFPPGPESHLISCLKSLDIFQIPTDEDSPKPTPFALLADAVIEVGKRLLSVCPAQTFPPQDIFGRDPPDVVQVGPRTMAKVNNWFDLCLNLVRSRLHFKFTDSERKKLGDVLSQWENHPGKKRGNQEGNQRSEENHDIAGCSAPSHEYDHFSPFGVFMAIVCYIQFKCDANKAQCDIREKYYWETAIGNFISKQTFTIPELFDKVEHDAPIPIPFIHHLPMDELGPKTYMGIRDRNKVTSLHPVFNVIIGHVQTVSVSILESMVQNVGDDVDVSNDPIIVYSDDVVQWLQLACTETEDVMKSFQIKANNRRKQYCFNSNRIYQNDHRYTAAWRDCFDRCVYLCGNEISQLWPNRAIIRSLFAKSKLSSAN